MSALLPLTKILLREACRLEAAGLAASPVVMHAGLAYLQGLSTSLASTASSGGQQIVSTSAAGKSVAFASGFSLDQQLLAADEALALFDAYNLVDLSTLLSFRPQRKARVIFGGGAYCGYGFN